MCIHKQHILFLFQLRQSSGLVTFEDKEVQTDDINPAEEVDIASRTKNEGGFS